VLDTVEDEEAALDELHGQLSNGENRESLLENGFIPTHTRVLIDAGLRMLPTLESNVAEDQAAGRLRAIIIKLELSANDDETARKAIDRLGEALADYRRSDKIMGRWVGAILLGITGAIVYYGCIPS